MDALRWLLSDEFARFKGVFAPSGPYGVPALAGALIFALCWFALRRRAHGREFRLNAFLRAIFPRRIWLHPSSLVDMRLWALNTLVFASGYGLLALGALACRDATVATMTRMFGAHAPTHWPVALVMTLGTLAELLAIEFGYWAAHYLFHRIPALWEFHKVHHSAEVMTTFTEMRQHPVEIVAFLNIIALVSGTTFGIMTYVFGPGVGRYTLLNSNIVLTMFLLTWGHLRHSHLWIPFRGLMGRVFQSPAHHQVHHSTDPRHFDKNLGFALAIWDWAFGTLYVPSRQREVSQYGVGEHREDYVTASRALTRPFARAGELLAPTAIVDPDRQHG